MQKRYLLPFIFLFFIFSCQEEEPAPEVYVSDFYPEFYGTDIIKSTYPENGEINVDNLTDIEIEFDKGIYKDNINDTVFEENILYEKELYTLNDVKKIFGHTYRIVLDSFTVLNNNEKNIAGKIVWEETGTGFTYCFPEVLPGEQTIKINIKTHIEELIDEVWTQLIYLDGEEAIYNNTYSFTCIEEADTIISTNILAAYPEDNMLNLYKGEYPEGGIKLFKAQTKCFELGPNETSFVRFTSTDNTFTVDYTVQTMSEDGQLISFPLPEALEHEKIYKLELVRSNSVSKAEKILYSIFFRVSMYNTLKEKLDDSEIKCGWVDHKINDSRGYLIIKSAQLKNIELFDPFETENIQCISGFIGVWYDNYVFALIYEYAKELQELGLVYPSTESGYNVPPLNAAYIKQNHYYSSNSLENNIVKFPEEAYVVNNGHEMFYYDYRAVSSFIYRLKNDPDFIVPEGLIEYFDYVYNHGYGGYGTEDFSVTLQYYIPAFDYYGTEKTIWVDNAALNE